MSAFLFLCCTQSFQGQNPAVYETRHMFKSLCLGIYSNALQALSRVHAHLGGTSWALLLHSRFRIRH